MLEIFEENRAIAKEIWKFYIEMINGLHTDLPFSKVDETEILIGLRKLRRKYHSNPFARDFICTIEHELDRELKQVEKEHIDNTFMTEYDCFVDDCICNR